jgi:hypothetical protein
LALEPALVWWRKEILVQPWSHGGEDKNPCPYWKMKADFSVKTCWCACVHACVCVCVCTHLSSCNLNIIKISHTLTSKLKFICLLIESHIK